MEHGTRPSRPRLREHGIIVGTLPTGRGNAITDVPGVRVGHCTGSFEAGLLVPGRGPARTGVTAILPHGDVLFHARVSAAHVAGGFVACTTVGRDGHRVAGLPVADTLVLLAVHGLAP